MSSPNAPPRFRALRIDKTAQGQRVSLDLFDEADLMEGDVDVAISHSTLNYKDGLALTGKAPVVRRFPMIPGIDFAGVVTRSSHPDWRAGDAAILNGWGCGETHLGGYAETARVKGAHLTRLPPGLTPAQAMAIGTAGYTAMLAVSALERHGVTPAQGPALVTGAAGGVGSIALALLAARGWSVHASTGRPEESAYLQDLGASEIVERASLSGPGKPLGKERWAAAVDSVGSHTLANVLAQISYGGAVAACGLAQGMDLPGSVAPFILRGVSLLGVDSVMAPAALRDEAWARLARDLDMAKLERMTQFIGLDEVEEFGAQILAGRVRGRLVVEIRPQARQRSDWRVEPMRARRRVACDIALSPLEAERVRRGHRPTQMEDKWFFFQEGDILHACRSWTGYVVYEMRLEPASDGGARVSALDFETDGERYRHGEPEEEIERARSLLKSRFAVTF